MNLNRCPHVDDHEVFPHNYRPQVGPSSWPQQFLLRRIRLDDVRIHCKLRLYERKNLTRSFWRDVVLYN